MNAPCLDLLAGWRAARAVASVASAADAVATPATPQKTAIIASVATVASANAQGSACAAAEAPGLVLMRAPNPAAIPSSAAIRGAVATWPVDLRDAFDERAAIMEYDGGERRDVAERVAYVELWPRARDALVPTRPNHEVQK